MVTEVVHRFALYMFAQIVVVRFFSLQIANSFHPLLLEIQYNMYPLI